METLETGVTAPSRPPFVRAFMTHAIGDAEIEALSTGRDEEFAKIVDAIERSRRAAPGSVQHVALYGPRGFGKSFLARRAQIAAAAMGGELGPVRYVLLPEEQHNLHKSPHALLETIAAHLDGLGREDDAAFREVAFRWPKPDEAVRRWNEAAARLEASIDAALPEGRGLVVVAIENFDQMLATLFRDHRDEQRLRGWLDRRGNRLMVFATATGTVDTDYERPLFRMFQPVRLRPWSVEDCLDYFARARAFAGESPLGAEQQAKARAVAEFIGGTPRLALSLAEVLDTEDALSVAATMDALAEKLAEYYRRRIEDLPPLGGGLLDALIRGGEPASATELARRVGAGQNQIAQFMKSLTVADVLRGERAPDSRETLYRVADRVFAHYYRLRQGSHAARATPLATILDFLKSFYSRDERREQALRYLTAGRPAEGALFSRLAREGEPGSPGAYERGFAYRLGIYLDAAPEALGMDAAAMAALMEADPAKAFEHCRGRAATEPTAAAIGAVVKAQALTRLGHEAAARRELQGALVATETAAGRIIAGLEFWAFLENVERNRSAAAEIGASLREIAADALPLCLAVRRLRAISWSLGVLRRHDEAIDAAARAVEAERRADDAGEEAESLRHMAHSLFELGRHEEAIDAAARAVEAARRAGDAGGEAASLRHMAYSLGQLGRHDRAIDAAARAVEAARRTGDAGEEAESLRLMAYLLGRLGRHEEAIDAAAQAVEAARRAGDAGGEAESLWLMADSLRVLGRFEEALLRARESFEIARARSDSFNLSWAALQATLAARASAHPDIVSIYRDWLDAWRAKAANERLANPTLWISDLLVAVARADAYAAFDELSAEWREAGAATPTMLLSPHRVGRGLAKLAPERGRAAGFAAVAGLAPRIVALDALAAARLGGDPSVTAFVSGFASGCRDPGLLRDVAGLLTADLAPDAPRAAAMLRALAGVDEAADKAAVLARVDPDMATAIRRLRGLPDPPAPAPRARAAARSGRPKAKRSK